MSLRKLMVPFVTYFRPFDKKKRLFYNFLCLHNINCITIFVQTIIVIHFMLHYLLFGEIPVGSFFCLPFKSLRYRKLSSDTARCIRHANPSFFTSFSQGRCVVVSDYTYRRILKRRYGKV